MTLRPKAGPVYLISDYLDIRSCLYVVLQTPLYISRPSPTMTDTRPSILITGCSSPGIGYYLAQVFHEHGYRVFPTARNAGSLADLEAMGMEPISLTVDNEDSVLACHHEVSRRLGGRGLDIFYQNAGRSKFEEVFRLTIFIFVMNFRKRQYTEN